MKDKRRIAIINSVSTQSTGKIAVGLYKYFRMKKTPCIFCYGYGKKEEKGFYRIDSTIEHNIHALLCRLTGLQGFYSTAGTKKLIRLLRKHKINTIYGVNLHGYYINEKILFDYMKRDNIKFVYIMVDEYPYCGKCGYRQGCTNNETGCGNCPQIHEYPKSLIFDRTKKIFQMKMAAYNGLMDAVFVGPEYTVLQAKKSPLLKENTFKIIDEAVNTDFYYPRETEKIRRELGITEEKIIFVCVAPSNYERKGTRYFTELARRYENNDRYIFIHVGYVGDTADLPLNYIAIGFEADQERLAQYYSMGDLFIFPSLLDTMPNACLEALACGTPLLCFDISGMPYIADSDVMTLVEAKNVDQMVKVVAYTEKKTKRTIEKCREYAVKRYSYQKYFDLLNEMSERV